MSGIKGKASCQSTNTDKEELFICIDSVQIWKYVQELCKIQPFQNGVQEQQ